MHTEYIMYETFIKEGRNEQFEFQEDKILYLNKETKKDIYAIKLLI
jgi:hypothetical protein